ncbi:Mitochondrial import receptor subunit [Podosphaera aphanis]|nr:Mitochondrial import receptor subunit [Podosphaera aphanis]
MSTPSQVPTGSSAPVLTSSTSSSVTWNRISIWASENKAVVCTIAGVAVVVTGAGIAYYLTDSTPSKSDQPSQKKSSKKERRRKKDDGKRNASPEKPTPEPKSKSPLTQPTSELPDINEENVGTYTEQQRKEFASKLKIAGNAAFGEKKYTEAIGLYGKAILCKPDPIFYSNRAACYNALQEWEKVVEDTTAAINLDNDYVKALNRRAVAYEHLEKYKEALLDFTASCIIDSFRNDTSAQAVERLLKKVAETKGKLMLANRKKRLPSPNFVSSYLQSFRIKPTPPGLEIGAEIPEGTGLAQLQAGLRAMEKKTSEGYEEAATAFDKALELGNLAEHEAFAYNLRGTFRYLRGDNVDAFEDLTKSIELDPNLTQSFIKRASMHLENGKREEAIEDFEMALKQNPKDPDIFYHRAQFHFIMEEFNDASKDYQISIELDPDFIFSYVQLGVTQYKMGSIASSMATFRKCIKKFSNAPDVYNYYGELLLDQRNYQEAIDNFDKAVDLEKQTRPMNMNVLPLINKALVLFQSNKDFPEAEKLVQKALIIDPECEIAVATLAQLLLQQGKTIEALKYFERAAELSRTEGEIVNALSFAEATRTQLEVQELYPKLASRLQKMGLNQKF